MRKRVLILGSTGMLGNDVVQLFQQNKDLLTKTTYRTPVEGFDGSVKFDALTDPIEKIGKDYDYVINCIGVIKPHMINTSASAIKINAIFPLELAEYCKGNNINLIHITTDCVYSGSVGKYTESAAHDALDSYGKSKSLGESVFNSMVLRTSIIGEEVRNFTSLLSWAKSQMHQTVAGYETHYWNGITTNWYAKICEKIICSDHYENGLFHVFAAEDVSKYQFLECFNKRFDLDLEILRVYTEIVDRTLRTEKALCSWLEIPTVEQMVNEM